MEKMAEIDLRKRRKPIKRFYKYGVTLCDSKWPYYGGHTHWLSSALRVDYLALGFRLGLKYNCIYYDGYHHDLIIGIFNISWGGWPYKETNV
jgi:hypothetical protein